MIFVDGTSYKWSLILFQSLSKAIAQTMTMSADQVIKNEDFTEVS